MNTSSPDINNLEVALKQYKSALKPLKTTNKLLKKQALELLSARDNLQKQLESEEKIPINLWSKLIVRDKRLKQNAYKITEVLGSSRDFYRLTHPTI